MPTFIRYVTRPITSGAFDAKAGQMACWIASATVLVLGILKLRPLPLSEAELFFGLLLLIAVSLLGILIGLVLPLATASGRQS